MTIADLAGAWWPRTIRQLTAACMVTGLILTSPNTHATTAAALPEPSFSVRKGHGRVLQFNKPLKTILVADDTVADVKALSPGVVYLHGNAVGSTNLVALDGNHRTVGTFTVVVSPEGGEEGNDIAIKATGGRLRGSGMVSDVGEAVDVNAMLVSSSAGIPLNLTTYMPSTQVNIRVRFAEVSREKLLRHGVNLAGLFSSGNIRFALATGTPFPTDSSTNLFGAGIGATGYSMDALIDAMQANGALEILAEPNITAMTGTTASFLAGGEIPIPVPVNRDLVGIQYKTYGISLSVTPTLLPNDRIALDVTPEVSTISPTSSLEIAGTTVPSFLVRRVDTRVEMGSGQTFAIAGLFQKSSSNDIRKLPVLGDIPVLGALFRSRRFQRNETELVVLITPYLVRPVSDDRLQVPLGRCQKPTGAMPSESDGMPDCVNPANLESMVEQPADLRRGRTPGPAMAVPVAKAVERYLDAGERKQTADPAHTLRSIGDKVNERSSGR
jgi:pilus assembly protein CpaC